MPGIPELDAAGWLVMVLAAGMVLGGCGYAEESPPPPSGEGTAADRVVDELPPEDVPDTSGLIPVEGFPGPTFYVRNRSGALKQDPCAACHAGDPEPDRPGPRRAHWDVEVRHGGTSLGEDLSCRTCHRIDRPAVLRTVTGDTAPITRSHRQCAGCHQAQVRDWAGGAHGKRRRLWAGPRVVYGCAECHDPHDPALESRWPVTYPDVPRGGKGELRDE